MPAAVGSHDRAPGFKYLKKAGTGKEWRQSRAQSSLYGKTKMLPFVRLKVTVIAHINNS